MEILEKDRARFWSQVDKIGGCWVWVGALYPDGHGRFYRSDTKLTVGAHRYSFTLTHDDPGDLRVLQRCNNHKCVNPEHLFLSTRVLSDNDEERFWSKVNKTNNCWEWTDVLDKDGYGKFWHNRRNVRAHRYSYTLVHGDPGKLHVLHKCDNPKCVNPEHLFSGTQDDNIEDKVNKGRTVKGVRVFTARLNEQLVVAIRERYAQSNTTFQALAEEFGIGLNTAWLVVNRRTWKHVL